MGIKEEQNDKSSVKKKANELNELVSVLIPCSEDNYREHPLAQKSDRTNLKYELSYQLYNNEQLT